MTISLTQTSIFKDRWTVEVVDDGSLVGDGNSIALDSEGNPHISYVDKQTSSLKYAFWDGGEWNLESVDNEILVGTSETYIDNHDVIHIIYTHELTGIGHYDKYAQKSGDEWDVMTLDFNGRWSPIIDIDSEGRMMLVQSQYYSENSALMIFKWVEGGPPEPPDIQSEGIITSSDLVFGSDDSVHILYQERIGQFYSEAFYLTYYGTYEDGEWVLSLIENRSMYVGDVLNFRPAYSLFLDSDNEPSLFYINQSQVLVRKHLSGNEWKDEPVYPETAKVDEYSYDNLPVASCRIDIDTKGNFHILLIGDTKDHLIYGKQSGGQWVFETVLSSTKVGQGDLVIDSYGNVHISHFNEITGNLEYIKGQTTKYDNYIFTANTITIAVVIIWLAISYSKGKESRDNHQE
ncbi:MAG: hypothetical protein KAS67_04330 [Thermoplasmata archaeon]|nr:hypothetical protein [Thermoplasmata archaeon]